MAQKINATTLRVGRFQPSHQYWFAEPSSSNAGLVYGDALFQSLFESTRVLNTNLSGLSIPKTFPNPNRVSALSYSASGVSATKAGGSSVSGGKPPPKSVSGRGGWGQGQGLGAGQSQGEGALFGESVEVFQGRTDTLRSFWQIPYSIQNVSQRSFPQSQSSGFGGVGRFGAATQKTLPPKRRGGDVCTLAPETAQGDVSFSTGNEMDEMNDKTLSAKALADTSTPPRQSVSALAVSQTMEAGALLALKLLRRQQLRQKLSPRLDWVGGQEQKQTSSMWEGRNAPDFRDPQNLCMIFAESLSRSSLGAKETCLALAASSQRAPEAMTQTRAFTTADSLCEYVVYHLQQRTPSAKVKDLWKTITQCLGTGIHSTSGPMQKSATALKTSGLKLWERKGIAGVKLACSGRLEGAEMAYTEKRKTGNTKVHRFADKVDFSLKFAYTPYGVVGVRAWVRYK